MRKSMKLSLLPNRRLSQHPRSLLLLLLRPPRPRDSRDPLEILNLLKKASAALRLVREPAREAAEVETEEVPAEETEVAREEAEVASKVRDPRDPTTVRAEAAAEVTVPDTDPRPLVSKVRLKLRVPRVLPRRERTTVTEARDTDSKAIQDTRVIILMTDRTAPAEAEELSRELRVRSRESTERRAKMRLKVLRERPPRDPREREETTTEAEEAEAEVIEDPDNKKVRSPLVRTKKRKRRRVRPPPLSKPLLRMLLRRPRKKRPRLRLSPLRKSPQVLPSRSSRLSRRPSKPTSKRLKADKSKLSLPRTSRRLMLRRRRSPLLPALLETLSSTTLVLPRTSTTTCSDSKAALTKRTSKPEAREEEEEAAEAATEVVAVATEVVLKERTEAVLEAKSFSTTMMLSPPCEETGSPL